MSIIFQINTLSGLISFEFLEVIIDFKIAFLAICDL